MPIGYFSARRTKSWVLLKSSIFCQSRQPARPIHYSNFLTSPKWSNPQAGVSVNWTSRRNYATERLDVQRLRVDVDQRARLGFYTLTNKENILHIAPTTANSIIADFNHQKNKLNYGANIQRLSEKYKVSMEDLASLAIVTFNIKDLADPEKRAMLPPSQHKYLSSFMLQGCAQAEDPLAIMQILSAMYLRNSTSSTSIKEMAGLFPPNEIVKYRKTLEKLGEKAQTIPLGPDVLTLQGLFLEREGQKQKAKELYQKALSLCHLKFNPNSKHPMQLKMVEPWNALGFLLKTDQSPEAQAEAKSYFKKGAFEADDPLSYFELAKFEKRSSPEWIRYTSKAAASGHTQAIVHLADFYQEVTLKDSPLLKSNVMQKALNWLVGWKRDSAAMLAVEWLQVATNTGHKPSMLKLAEYYEAQGERERAREYLQQVMKPPSLANQSEEWPEQVQLARKKLAGIKA